MTTAQDPLPLPCGQVLPNRIMKAAMSEALGTRTNAPDERLERLYRTWSTGGYGLLVTGNTIKGATTSGGNGIHILSSSNGLVTGNRISTWNTCITISASVCDDLVVMANQLRNFTTRVSNSGTGARCYVAGNSLASVFDYAAPLGLAQYATGSLPAPNATAPDNFGAGALAYDSTLGRVVLSTTSLWRTIPIIIQKIQTLDFPSIAAHSSAELTITGMSGVSAGDSVALGAPSSIEAGLAWNGIAQSGSVKVRLTNATDAAIDPASARRRSRSTRCSGSRTR